MEFGIARATTHCPLAALIANERSGRGTSSAHLKLGNETKRNEIDCSRVAEAAAAKTKQLEE